MSLIIISIFSLFFSLKTLAADAPKEAPGFDSNSALVWSQAGFKKACKTEGKLRIHVEKGRTQLVCESRHGEIASTWFDKDQKMLGWLKRSRNSEGILIKDEEFDPQGLIKEETSLIRSAGQANEKIQNLFVFDSAGALKRGNIVLGENHFVIATPGLIFLNGQPSNIEILANQLQKKFAVSSQQSFEKQIQEIWKKQNPGKTAPEISQKPTKATQ